MTTAQDFPLFCLWLSRHVMLLRERSRHCLPVLMMCCLPSFAPAAESEVVVATASNFVGALKALRTTFQQAHAGRIRITPGSTGTLYAQIMSGAPYDILLAADQARPMLLAQNGYGVSNSRFTYALGRLVLWSPKPGSPLNRDSLRGRHFERLAIANPDLAPYGAAANDFLVALNDYDDIRNKLVYGTNVGQTLTLVATGNADLGFVALSQILGDSSLRQGRYWVVPTSLYRPIRQDAILLGSAAGNEVAQEFLEFLKTPETRRLIEAQGYGVEPQAALPNL